MGIDTRYRAPDGEISRKHGDTLILTLRRTYGPGFAMGFTGSEKLRAVLQKLDEMSLSHLIRDYEAGYLHQICRQRGVRGAATEPTLSASQGE